MKKTPYLSVKILFNPCHLCAKKKCFQSNFSKKIIIVIKTFSVFAKNYKYNFKKSQVKNKRNYITRQSYIDKIQPFIEKQLVKVITGHRRVGKSYILYQLMDIIIQNDKKCNIIYGGLPYLIHLPMKEEIVLEYLRSIYSTIILKDVVQRKNIRNTYSLEQLIKFLANNIGHLFSAKSISDFLSADGNYKIKR